MFGARSRRRRVSPRTPFALVAVLAVLAACSGGDDPSTGTAAPSPSESAPVNTAAPAEPLVRTGRISGHDLRLTVRPVVRQGGGALITGRLELLEPALGADAWTIGQTFGDPSRARYTAAELRLIDPVARTVHVAHVNGSGCACSTGLDRVRLTKDKPLVLAAAVAAPSGQRVDVVWPGFGVIPDVPVEDGKPPAIQRPDGRGVQAFDLTAAAATGAIPLEEFRESAGGGVREVRLGDRRTIRLDSRQLFPEEGASIFGGAGPLTDRAAALLRDRPGPLTVVGYTADTGPDQQNRELSRRRAQAVADALVAAGLDAGQYPVTVQGAGETHPVAPPTGNTARRLNDRIEIVRTVRPSGPPPALRAPQWFTGGSSVVGIRTGAQVGLTMRVERVLHRGPYVAVDLEVRADRRRAPTVGTMLARAVNDPRGDPGPAGAYSARGVRLLGQSETIWPIDYRIGRERACLCDRFAVDAVPPGGVRRLTVIFPAPAESDPAVAVDIPVLGRLTDVPVAPSS